MGHRGNISLDLVCDFYSYPTLQAWNISKTYIEDLRADLGRDTPWE